MTEKPSTPWLEKEDLNRIKQSVSLEQLLQHYGLFERCKLKGNNGRLKGFSPFREEKNPSFAVDLEGDKWNDFPRPMVGSKEVPGNIFGLVMALEGVGFREAALKLNELAGNASPESTTVTRQRSGVKRTLASSPVSQEPNVPFGKELKGLRYDVPYLQEEKQLSPDRAKYWGVGYCSRGLFKGRIVVPIKNREGTITGYVGRSLKDDDESGRWKFPNGFRKLQELWNIDKLANDPEAKAAVAKYGIIVCEGVFDALMLSERGFKNASAVFGTELSDAQVAMLTDPDLNPTRVVKLMFDNDDGGREGMRRAYGRLRHKAAIWDVDYNVFGSERLEGRTDPDQFTKEELRILLRIDPAEPA